MVNKNKPSSQDEIASLTKTVEKLQSECAKQEMQIDGLTAIRKNIERRINIILTDSTSIAGKGGSAHHLDASTLSHLRVALAKVNTKISEAQGSLYTTQEKADKAENVLNAKLKDVKPTATTTPADIATTTIQSPDQDDSYSPKRPGRK